MAELIKIQNSSPSRYLFCYVFCPIRITVLVLEIDIDKACLSSFVDVRTEIPVLLGVFPLNSSQVINDYPEVAMVSIWGLPGYNRYLYITCRIHKK